MIIIAILAASIGDSQCVRPGLLAWSHAGLAKPGCALTLRRRGACGIPACAHGEEEEDRTAVTANGMASITSFSNREKTFVEAWGLEAGGTLLALAPGGASCLRRHRVQRPGALLRLRGGGKHFNKGDHKGKASGRGEGILGGEVQSTLDFAGSPDLGHEGAQAVD